MRPTDDKGLAALHADIATDATRPETAVEALAMLGGNLDCIVARLALTGAQLPAHHKAPPQAGCWPRCRGLDRSVP